MSAAMLLILRPLLLKAAVAVPVAILVTGTKYYTMKVLVRMEKKHAALKEEMKTLKDKD